MKGRRQERASCSLASEVTCALSFLICPRRLNASSSSCTSLTSTMPVTTEETLALVHSLSAYVSSTLASLSQPPTASPSSLSSTTPPPPTLSAIRSDLSLLFQDCNKHLTASALALKPVSYTHLTLPTIYSV